jgi:hypothetical protein
MKIKSYNEFIGESIVETDNLFNSIVESLWNTELLTTDEKKLLESELVNPIIFINENFFDKLKSRYDKAKVVAKDISQGAKDALEKLVDAAKQVADFIKQFKDFLSKQVKLILTQTKDKIKEKLKSNQKLNSEIKSKLSSDKSAFLGELDILKGVVAFYQTKLYVALETQITNGLTKFLSSEDKEIPVAEKLSIIKEGSNMLDKLVHGLNSIPPFSWIDKLQKIGEKGANFIIKQLAFITEKLGGPYFELPIIAVLLGIAFEYNMKGLAKSGLLDVVGMFSVPFVAPVIKMVGFVATMIAAYELIVAITKGSKEEDKLHDY